jgi:anti-sigma factor RsiW
LNCHPELVTGYVDGALDDLSAAQIKAHLEDCSDCRDQVEFEQSLRKGLRGLSVLEPRGDLRQEILKRSRRRRRRVLRWALPTAAVFVAISILTARTSAGFLAWELVKDHTHCFAPQPLELHVFGSNPESVASWFSEQGNHIPSPPAAAGGLELVGGRRCMLLDFVIVAHLLYEGEHRQASVFVLPNSRAIPDAYATEIGARAVRLVRVGGHTVGVVAETPEDAESFRRALVQSRAWNTLPGPFLTVNALAATIFVRPSGAVAQLGARVNGIHEVTGSIPVSSTKSRQQLTRSPG